MDIEGFVKALMEYEESKWIKFDRNNKELNVGNVLVVTINDVVIEAYILLGNVIIQNGSGRTVDITNRVTHYTSLPKPPTKPEDDRTVFSR
jgi:hypothetical protein